MEAEILRDVPEIDSVLTHIESEPATIEQPEEDGRSIARSSRRCVRRPSDFPEIVDVHEIRWAARESTFRSPAIARCPTNCPCGACMR